MERVFAISNQKGGVGKTTTAVNLSACFAAAEKKVLIIDLDPQANATSGLGISQEELEGSMYDVLVDEKPIKDIILQTELKYLDVAPATKDLVGAEVELVNSIGREYKLKEAIQQIGHAYDFIFIDCPPALGLLTVNALTGSNGVIIPLQCEYYAMEGLSQLMATIKIIQKRLNPNLLLDGIILTMYDRRNNLSFQVEDEIKKHFKNELIYPFIPRNVKLSEAPSHGKPIILYDINSSGAAAYMDVSRNLLKRFDYSSSQESKKELIQSKEGHTFS